MKLQSLLPIVQHNSMVLIEKFTAKQARLTAEETAVKSDIDVVDGFATQLPLNVIVDVVDLSQEPHEMFHGWYRAMMNGISGGPALRVAGQKLMRNIMSILIP